MKNEDIMIFIHRFNVLRNKINFEIKLNDLDKKLIYILDKYNYYVDDIKKERREQLIEKLRKCKNDK